MKKLGKKKAGRYGSAAFGLFNGGGYHALEKNENKTLEGRLTLRPLPTLLPGLQGSYHGAFGRGNIAEAPVWEAHSAFLSFEHSRLVLTAEYYQGLGNVGGSAVQDTINFEAVPQNGYSVFTELKVLKDRVSLFGRYDHFTQEFDSGDKVKDRSIVGLAFHLSGSSKIIVDYDMASDPARSDSDSQLFEVALELKY